MVHMHALIKSANYKVKKVEWTMCFSCDTYLQDSRVIQKTVYVVPFYYGRIDSESFFFIGQMFGILISVHEERVGNTSGCLFIFSKRNNLKVSVKKISCITLLLTQWQGTIDRAFVFAFRQDFSDISLRFSQVVCLIRYYTSNVGVSIESEGIIIECVLVECVYTPHPTIKARMIVYSPNFQP